MNLTFFGTNSLLIRNGPSALLVDPYFSRLGFRKLIKHIEPSQNRIKAALADAGIQNADGVVLTHAHYDHALDAAEITKRTGGILYGSESAINLAIGSGLMHDQFQMMKSGGTCKIGSFNVQFHPSRHIPFGAPLKWLLPEKERISQPFSPPTWFWDYQCGEVFAIQVDHVLIFGSAGFLPGAYNDLAIETLVLGIGGLETKPRNYLEAFFQETVLATGAKQVFISHWDNFFRPADLGLKPLGWSKHTIQQLIILGQKQDLRVNALHYGIPLQV